MKIVHSINLVKAIYLAVFSAERDVTSFWRHRDKLLSAHGPLARYWHRFLCERIERRFNAFIPPTAVFASRPKLPHQLNGIFVSGGAVVGRDCVIFHQVTIGSNTLSDSSRAGSPTVGDNVYIGCGAKIIGRVKIGDNVRIGANCVVTSDVEANATVVAGNPRVISRGGPRENVFIQYSDVGREDELG